MKELKTIIHNSQRHSNK